MDLILKRESYAIIGSAMEVANELGCGFLEPVYQEALGFELRSRNIPHVQHPQITISYKGQRLTKTYVADFICFDRIIVEIKALKEITGTEQAQILNYLKATGLPLGFLMNFGTPSFKFRRFINTRR